jgi:hypothetical protein
MRLSHGDKGDLRLAASGDVGNMEKGGTAGIALCPSAHCRARDAKKPRGIAHIEQTRAEPWVVHLTVYLPRPNSYTTSEFVNGGSSEQPLDPSVSAGAPNEPGAPPAAHTAVKWRRPRPWVRSQPLATRWVNP